MNNIKKVLQTKGFAELRPSDNLLLKMDIKVHTWNKWVENKKDPEIWQLVILADFLGCEMSDLIEKKNEKHRV